MSELATTHRMLSMFLRLFLLLVACSIGTLSAADHSGKLKAGKAVKFHGKIEGELDISGGVVVGKFLLIVSNESHCVQVLKPRDDGDYDIVGDIVLAPKGTHLDLEAMTAEGDTVYVTGSHGRVRIPSMKDAELGQVLAIPSRDRVFRFKLDADGKAGKIDCVSLRKVLDADAVLKAFVPIASKENGIDIEGLAAKDGKLYFGFRGPVLRDNWCPVLVGEFDKLQETAELRYVQLGGRGIRDIAPVKHGFLILAGPAGSAELGFQLYHWDGLSGLAAKEGAGKAVLIDRVHAGAKHKPEGLIVLKESGKGADLLILHDGVAGGDPTEFAVEWKK